VTRLYESKGFRINTSVHRINVNNNKRALMSVQAQSVTKSFVLAEISFTDDVRNNYRMVTLLTSRLRIKFNQNLQPLSKTLIKPLKNGRQQVLIDYKSSKSMFLGMVKANQVGKRSKQHQDEVLLYEEILGAQRSAIFMDMRRPVCSAEENGGK